MKQFRAVLYQVVENILGRSLTKEEREAIKKCLVAYSEAIKSEK